MVKSYVMSGLLNNNEVPANPAAYASIAHLPEKFTTGTKFKKKNSTRNFMSQHSLDIYVMTSNF